MRPSSESTRGCWPHMRLRWSDSSLIKFERFRSVKTGGHVAIRSLCAQEGSMECGDLGRFWLTKTKALTSQRTPNAPVIQRNSFVGAGQSNLVWTPLAYEPLARFAFELIRRPHRRLFFVPLSSH